jgi:hypothetical protein
MDEGSDPFATTFRIREGALAWRAVGAEVVVFDIGRAVYFGLNRTAAALWTALAAGATRHQLLCVALESFQVDAERAASDIDSLLADLARRGLLEGSYSPDRPKTTLP